MKRRTKAQQFEGIANVVKAMNNGETPKSKTRQDGSMGTKPIVPCDDKPESTVLNECIIWLRKHGCIADRMNVGAGDFGGGFKTYGIVGGGDILVTLPNGRHCEIECKAGRGGSWSGVQQKRCRKIRGNNAVYMVIHGVEELEYRFQQEGLI